MKYLGNKSRLENFLNPFFKIEDNGKKNALDLFAGTGNVSYMLTKNGYNVDSVDILELSKIYTYVRTNTTPQIENDIISNIENTIIESFITNHYSDKVNVNIFKEDIAKHIDGSILKLNELKDQLTIEQYYFILNSIIEASDFRSNIMGSYESFYKKGWRTQALKNWKLEIFQNENLTNNNFYVSSINDFFVNNTKIYDLVYADPPYNSRNYSKVFHVLETIATNYIGKTKGAVNTPTEEKNKSPFNSKREVKNGFQSLFKNASKITNKFLLSYSNEGIIEINDIVKLSKEYFTDYTINYIDYRKFNTNKKNTKNNKVNEYLIEFKK
jgi:adenine-specific DNA-methyltransferase